VATYRIEGFSLSADASPQLRAAGIDEPAAGSEGDVHALDVRGWALGRDQRAAWVEALHGDTVLQRRRILIRRPDVEAAFPAAEPGACGFRVLVGMVGLPERFELRLETVLADGSRARIGTIAGRREPLRSGFEPAVQPLMVTTIGRSGSTWIMRMLASHPDVVAYDFYPYESWPARYWAHVLKVLVAPGSPDSSHPHLFESEEFEVGRNPFYNPRAFNDPLLREWLGRSQVERTAAFVQGMIEDSYLTLARSQQKRGLRYFAEKVFLKQPLAPVLMRELYPQAREVFLVRDLRDVASSMLALKRDVYGDERWGSAEQELVWERTRAAARTLRDAWISRRESSHLVRYEDLILQPHETLTAVLEYLELERSVEIVERMAGRSWGEDQRLPGHPGAADPRRTIGRWRNVEDDEFQERSRAAFEDVLVEFGYL
jgi:hypothetical protein